MDATPAAPVDVERSAPRADAEDAAQQPAPPAVMFSVYNYGFRFLREEVDVLEDIFARNGGATPSRAHLHRIAAAMSATPARLAEPPHPVREKQIKTWFENRRQKLRRQRDRAAGRSSAGCRRSRSAEQLADADAEGGGDDGEDASIMAAATALLEASAAVPTSRGEQPDSPPPPPPAALTPVRGVPIIASVGAGGDAPPPTAVAALAAPAEAACGGDGGIGALLHGIREEVQRSSLAAHTQELLLLHLLHSWSVLRTLADPAQPRG